MHRRYVRAIINVDSTEKDIPIDFIADGHVLVYKDDVIKTDTLILADVVTGVGTSTLNEIPVYNDATGRVITSSGSLITDVVFASSLSVVNSIACYVDTTGRLIQDSGILVTDVVRGPASAVTNRVAIFNGTSGKLIADSGTLITDVVTAAGGTVTAGHIPQYSSTTGRQITNTGISSTNLVLSFTTPATNNVTAWQGVGKNVIDAGYLYTDVVLNIGGTVTSSNVPQFSGTTGRRLADTGVSISNVVLSFTTPATGNIIAWQGVSKNIIDGGKLAADLVTGPASVTTGRLASFNGTTGKIIQQTSIGESAGALTGVVSINGVTLTGTSGIVVGPSGGSTNNALAVWSGTSGTVLRNSGVNENTSGVLSLGGISASGNIASSTINTSIPTNNIVSYNAAVAGPLTNEIAAFDTSAFPYKISYRQVQITTAGAISQVTTLNGLTVSDIVTVSGAHVTDSVATWVSTGGSPVLQDSPVQIIGTDMQGINNISVSTINGIDPDSHASRHYDAVGGDSIIASTTWQVTDVLRWSGAQFDPKHMQVKVLGSLTVTSTPTVINNASVILAARSGGNYVLRYKFLFQGHDSTGNLSIAVTWSGGSCVAIVDFGLSAAQITSSGGSASVGLGTAPAAFSVEVSIGVVSAATSTTISVFASKSSGLSASIPTGGTVYAIQA